MYKNKDKQRQANRLSMQRLRAKNGGKTKNAVIELKKAVEDVPGSTNAGDTLPVIPSKVIPCATHVIPYHNLKPCPAGMS